MNYIPYEGGSYYIFDFSYVDYNRQYKITLLSAFFVVRAKSNLQFKRIFSQKIDKTTEVQSDQIGKLKGFYILKDYPVELRKVKYYDGEMNCTFVFLTNNMALTAQEITYIYMNRWQV